MEFERCIMGEKCIKGKVEVNWVAGKGNWTRYTERLALRIHRLCARQVMRWIGDGLA